MSLRLAKMQYKVLSLTFQARNLMLSKITTFQKYFINLGMFVFVLLLLKCVCVLGGEKSTRIICFLIWTFPIKRQRKHALSVSSCNSVNSAIMYNIKIIKMSFVIILIRKATPKMFTICRLKLDVKNI